VWWCCVGPLTAFNSAQSARNHALIPPHLNSISDKLHTYITCLGSTSPHCNLPSFMHITIIYTSYSSFLAPNLDFGDAIPLFPSTTKHAHRIGWNSRLRRRYRRFFPRIDTFGLTGGGSHQIKEATENSRRQIIVMRELFMLTIIRLVEMTDILQFN